MKVVPPGAAWRLLILDKSDPGDPRWLVATVTAPSDVRPAALGDEIPDDVTCRWAAGRGGTLTPLRGAAVWRVDGGR